MGHFWIKQGVITNISHRKYQDRRLSKILKYLTSEQIDLKNKQTQKLQKSIVVSFKFVFFPPTI